MVLHYNNDVHCGMFNLELRVWIKFYEVVDDDKIVQGCP